MSSRALRRLQADSGLSDFHVDAPNGISEDSDVENDGDGASECNANDTNFTKKGKRDRRKKQKNATLNPFELLNEPDNEEPEENEVEEPDPELETTSVLKTEAKGAKKKKKKNKKGKEKVAPDLNGGCSEKDPIDEVEASVQEVNRILGDPGTACAAEDRSSIQFSVNMKPLLHIDYRNLNPDTEMKRMFGSDLFRGEQQQRHRRRRNRPVLRSTKLVQVKDTWHSTGGSGLSMKYLGEENGFVYEHSSAYQKFQHRFLDGIESGYPENIFNILQENPYHIDTLISLADFYNINEDFQTGAECIEKALYGMECAFHSMFNLAAGNCFLDFKRRENRAMFICLFKHIVNLGQRGCNRTAFEFCKVLLSLDPSNDPLNCLSMIDYYALRCEQYDYLLRLEAEVSYSSTQLQTPNFAFSVALAHFKLALRSNGDTSKADKMLQDKLLLYPMMLLPLLDKCSIQPDKRVSSHKFFHSDPAHEKSNELGRLVQLYVRRCEACWKESGVLQWLERNVNTVLDIVDEGVDSRLETYPALRRQQFKHPPPSILRHYHLSGIAVPSNVSNRTVYGHDPYPPSDSIAGYTRPPRPTRAAGSDQGMLSLLLESLLPSYNPYELVDVNSRRRQNPQENGFAMGAMDDGLGDDLGGAGARAIPQQLQTSVNAIMDAMRQLLNRAVAIPNADEQGEADEENERAWEEDEENYQNDH
ncbi:transcription factor 25 [Aplysia californica]|uniref:Transcription factor 25 n=1 Tax=Aplysia californica TaxID=6500 RepID=A0ABM0K0E9_APLCA|nr:transcription factor 25 [Aplysia californica]